MTQRNPIAPGQGAINPHVTELHRLARQDYLVGRSQRVHTPLSAVHLTEQEHAAPQEQSDLAVAISIGQRMLTAYDGVGFGDIDGMARAHGALSESLRILLRALGAEVVAGQ